MPKLSVYLLFDGTCQAALERYQAIFGGALQLTTVGESPMANAFPAHLHQRVLHARLRNDWLDLPASDWLASDEAPQAGNQHCLYLEGPSLESIQLFFAQLAAGGRVTTPLERQPFGWYGRLVDRFGVIWMFQAPAD